MNELALQLIKENKETKDRFLDLGNCWLTEIPDELFECTWLEELNLSSEYINSNGESVPSKNRVVGHSHHRGPGNFNNFENGNFKSFENLQSLKALHISGIGFTNLTPLEKLINLQVLSVAYNQIIDITPLKDLANLKALNISYNKITEISALEKLIKLQNLNLYNNQINVITALEKLINLEILNLYNNLINDISPLVKLIRLKQLDLGYNKIVVFNNNLLNNLTHLEELTLINNPIRNIPEEIFSEYNCLTDIKSYFQDLNNGTTPIYEAKVILVGNGRVGKTSLVKRLLDNSFDPNEPSTHAIQLRQWELPELAIETKLKKIQINIWDFGGQDIYHATHRLFLKTTALFILVWDAKIEQEPEQKEILNNIRSITYKNHSLLYWLSYIKAQSENSPVIVVQSKRDIAGKQYPQLSNEEKKQYNIWRTLSVESSKSIANGFRDFQGSIEEILAEQAQKSCIEMPAQWYDVREEIEIMQQQHTKQISLKQFSEICKKQNLNESSTETLLKYLHNIGVVFYRKGLFYDHIIIDQKWAINAVYTLFDPKGNFVRIHSNGMFNGGDLQEAWKEYNLEEQELFLSFMKQCEICFEIFKEKDKFNLTAFHEREFIAPQLLPEEKPKSVSFAFDGKEGIYFKYKHSFLNAAVIQSLIVKIGYLSNINEMWKHGVLVKTNEGISLIETFPNEHQLLIRIKSSNPMGLLSKFKYFLTGINHDENEIKESVSLDGRSFILLENLRNHPVQNEMIQAEDGNWVHFQNYRQFLTQEESIKFEQHNQTEVMKINEPYIPKIYFSYAWGKDREKIVDELYNSLKKDGYFVIRDKEDIEYKGLISEFMQGIGKGDFVVVAISDKYLKSDNCMYELYELFRNSKLNKEELVQKIFPIRVESLNLNDPDARREYYEYWEILEAKTKELVNKYGEDQSKHRRIEAIKNAIRDLLLLLNDINTKTTEDLSNNNFEKIKESIQKRANEVGNS
ncbi:COR domain-containing protein [Paraflavisolibacter sp. H34]|uniref:COR domain-containing protein n=1 Tax=Huijunlia imazamoxiresistens TaxID=3127457 RepID=UPI0030165B8C